MKSSARAAPARLAPRTQTTSLKHTARIDLLPESPPLGSIGRILAKFPCWWTPPRTGVRSRFHLLCQQKAGLLLVPHCVAHHLFCQLNQARGNGIVRQRGCEASGFASEGSVASCLRAADFRSKSHSLPSQYGGAKMTMTTANADLDSMPVGTNANCRSRGNS